MINLRYALVYPAALRGMHAQEGPGGRHQQWRINPMTGDISNEGTKMVVQGFLALNKIELVTADFITRCCPAGKDVEKRLGSWLLRHWLIVPHSQISQNFTAGAYQGHTHIADGRKLNRESEPKGMQLFCGGRFVSYRSDAYLPAVNSIMLDFLNRQKDIQMISLKNADWR